MTADDHGEQAGRRSDSIGSHDDFVALVRHHSAAVHAYLSRRAGRQVADDLLGEVWLRALRSRHKYDPVLGSPSPWLYGIARNTLRAHWRLHAGRPQPPAEQTDEPWGQVDERLDAQRLAPQLAGALACLSPDDREILLLVAWEELTPAEVAVALPDPPGHRPQPTASGPPPSPTPPRRSPVDRTRPSISGGMTTMDALEQLSRYRHVEPVEDSVVTTAVDTITAALHCEPFAEVPKRRPATSRLRRGRRIATVSGAALAAIAAGGGIAAAAGLFNPSQRPPQAQSFMSSPDPAKVPGATLQLNVPGPEGTTLQVVTDDVTTTDQIADCVALGIIGPDSQPDAATALAGCSQGSFEPGGIVPTEHQVTPSINLQTWTAPSGASYYMIFGQAIPGVAEVTLSGSDGQVAATEPAEANGYVIYLPAASLATHRNLDFSDHAGRMLFSEDVGG